MMSFLSDPFVDEVEGNIEAPWFCVVVVSNICVDEVEDLVSPRVTRNSFSTEMKTPFSITIRGMEVIFVCRRGLIDI